MVNTGGLFLDPTIRLANPDDRSAIWGLADQLGYSSQPAEMERRLRNVLAEGEQAVFVAEGEGRVIGWVHVVRRVLLLDDPLADIGGLVVEQGCRGRGVGRLLLKRAEQWAVMRGCALVQVRSNIRRTEAHGFYEHLGFECTKTSKVFIKRLMRGKDC